MDNLILRTTGSVFGNFTASGFAGNSAIFDGVYVNNNPNLGAYAVGSSGYIGKDFTVPVSISKAHVYGWNDRGLVDDGNIGIVYLYGNNVYPVNDTDGILLGQVEVIEPSAVPYGYPVTVVSTDATTQYKYVWIKIVGNSTGICCAEVEFYTLETVAQPTYARPQAIFIGAGQSNMKGDAPVPNQSVYANRDRVSMYTLSGVVSPASDPMMEPTNSLWPQFTNSTVGCGPLISFGTTLVSEFKNFDILLVNSSKGSTSISSWARGQELYNGMIARASAALAAAPSGSFIAGFVWQQGESDTFSEAQAAQWIQDVNTLISNVREDLGVSELPVVIVGLGPYDEFSPAWKQLRFAQQYMTLPHHSAYVKTFDLINDSNPDWLNTTSVLTIGVRIAQIMKPLLPTIL